MAPPKRPAPDDEWEDVAEPTAAAADDGEWEDVTDAPEKSSGGGALAASAGLGGLAAALPAIKRGAEHLATSPALGKLVQRFAPAAGALNLGQSAYDVVTGRKSPTQAAVGAAKGEAVRQAVKRAPGLIQRAATPIAGASIPFAAGGLAGLAIPAGFLGALQHDANRQVDIDYSKNTPDTAIAKVFSNMLKSEANSKKTIAERMDDPNDVMFQADDSEIVRPTVQPKAEETGVVASLRKLLGV